MKKLITCLFILFGFIASAKAQTFEFDSIGFKHFEIGQLMLKGETWVIRVDRGGTYEDFMPVNLPDRYKSIGQDVVFEGAIGRIPMNVRLAGTPVKLSLIRILYKAKPEDGGGESIVNDDVVEKPLSADSTGYISNGIGKIILIGDVYLIEYMSDGEMKRFVPDYLPEEFKKENTEITFSAVIGSIPPNVRMMGTPITIKELMMVEEMELDNSKIQESLKSFFPFDSAGYQPAIQGVVKMIGADPVVYLIEIDKGQNNIMRYLPLILPDEFKKEGLAVIISGTIGKIPPNVRLMGTPLTIDEIKQAE